MPPTASPAMTSTGVAAMQFADTNVLLYAISNRANEAAKAGVALALLDRQDIALSTQVLQEFYVQATRTTRSRPLSHEQASGLVESFTRFPVQDVTVGIVRAAIALKGRYGLSLWDCTIVEAARAVGCDVVLSEDMQDGQDLDGVRIVNPFAVA